MAKPERSMDAEIRSFYGDNGTTCTVRINDDGTVERFGSAMSGDRSKDFWVALSTRAEAQRKVIDAYCRGA